MQLIPRYLVSNKTTIVANEAGFVTEYKPVYQKHINIYKGIDNVLEFKILNVDQKSIDLTNYITKFQAYDETNRLVIEHDGINVNATKGLVKVTVTQNDLLNFDQQYFSYNIHLVNQNSESVITYTDSHFGMNGTIYVSDEAMPGPADTAEVSAISVLGNDEWEIGPVTAEPGINGNEALHTAAIYTSGYIGDVIVQATLDSQVTNQTNWADVTTVTFTGSENQPKAINFNGVFNHLRFYTQSDPTDKITKILVRN
jgi:hypothetical protein